MCKNEPMKCILVIPFSQDTSLYNACLVKINNEFGFNFGDVNDILDCNCNLIFKTKVLHVHIYVHITLYILVLLKH